MKFPIILLSYGEFSQTKRLFIYENNGIAIMPIFYNTELIVNFIRHMQIKLKELGDDRQLRPQICAKPQSASDMFKFISSISPEMNTIVIDPTIEDDNIVENNIMGIDEIIEQIQSCLSDSSDSKTE